MGKANVQQFDAGKASDLAKQLKGEINSINGTLDDIQKQKIEPAREWWKGGSEEAFIENFSKTKKEISKYLEEWLNEYEKLIQKVVQVKQDQEAALKKALSK